jgi:hypothetical protein
MRIPALSFSVLLLIASCSRPESKQQENATIDSLTSPATSIDQQENAAPTSGIVTASEALSVKSDFSIEVFENKDGTGGFGYDLLNGGKVTIHQPHIPAVSGTSGFSSKEDAEKVGNLMLLKIQKGIMPPTITVEELDSLGIKH